MKTDDLIAALAADAPGAGPSQSVRWVAALAGALVLAGIAFSAGLGPRPDMLASFAAVRFTFKFVLMAVLTLSALAALIELSRPEAARPRVLLALGIAPAMALVAVGLELWAVPAGEWSRRFLGANYTVCLVSVPLMGAAPLALAIFTLRAGAPSQAGLAGAVAGVLAGAVAAFFYAAHCTDDSPLFVAFWYTLAIGVLAAAGAVAGRLFARW